MDFQSHLWEEKSILSCYFPFLFVRMKFSSVFSNRGHLEYPIVTNHRVANIVFFFSLSLILQLFQSTVSLVSKQLSFAFFILLFVLMKCTWLEKSPPISAHYCRLTSNQSFKHSQKFKQIANLNYLTTNEM